MQLSSIASKWKVMSSFARELMASEKMYILGMAKLIHSKNKIMEMTELSPRNTQICP